MLLLLERVYYVGLSNTKITRTSTMGGGGRAFFAFIGIVGDWALKRWFGEDPDEVRQFLLLLVPVVPDCIHLQKWDDYLSSYVESLPFSRHRAGTFKPLPSLWDRLFHRQTHPNPRSFEDDPSLAYPDTSSRSSSCCPRGYDCQHS